MISADCSLENYLFASLLVMYNSKSNPLVFLAGHALFHTVLGVILASSQAPWFWYILAYPFLPVAAVLMMAAGLACTLYGALIGNFLAFVAGFVLLFATMWSIPGLTLLSSGDEALSEFGWSKQKTVIVFAMTAWGSLIAGVIFNAIFPSALHAVAKLVLTILGVLISGFTR